MTETPDRPGEHGQHEDDRTISNGSAPSSDAGQASAPAASAGPSRSAWDFVGPESARPESDASPESVRLPDSAPPDSAPPDSAPPESAPSESAPPRGATASGNSDSPSTGPIATPPGGYGAPGDPATTPTTRYRPPTGPAATPPTGYGPSVGPGATRPIEYAGPIGTPPPGYGTPVEYGTDATPPTGFEQPGGPPPPGSGAGSTAAFGPQGTPGFGATPQGYGPPGYGPQGYGPPGYGPQGYGPPGYGPQAYGPPVYGPPGSGYGPPGFDTAPKPGIIPLRPLGFGDFFSGAFGYIWANPVSTLLPALVVAVITQLLQLAAGAALGVNSTSTSVTLQSNPGYVGRSFLASGIVVVVGLILGAALTAVLIMVLRGAMIGRRTDLATAWQAARPRVAGLVGVAVVTFLIVMVVMVVGFGIAIGLGVGIGGGAGAVVGVLIGIAVVVVLIYVAVLLSLATPAYVMEDIGVVTAITRSRELVRGVWWQVFAVLLVVVLAFSVVGGILFTIASVLGVAASLTPGSATPPVLGIGFSIALAVVVVIISTFSTPFLAGITGLLYADQRIRRERFDLQLANWAAGGR